MLIKILRALGMIAIPTSFVSIIGIAGSSDLNVLSFEQIVIYCTVALLIGVIGFVIVWITDIYKPKPIIPIVEKTPEQIYNKCCSCSNYACNKSFDEVIKCSNRMSLS